MAQGYTATLMVLLLALAVLGDLTAVARRGVTKSSFAAVHMSNDAKIEEPREEDRITGAAGGKGYFRRRKMKQVKVAFTTGGVNQNPIGKLCHKVEGKMSLGCELSHRVRSSGLVPFSSDYHAPNKHPAKNN